MNDSIYTRRNFLGGAAWTLTAGAAALYVPGVFAQKLQQTPRQTEGPFYPNKLPLDTDNDLLVLQQFNGIPILSPAQAAVLLGATGKA